MTRKNKHASDIISCYSYGIFCARTSTSNTTCFAAGRHRTPRTPPRAILARRDTSNPTRVRRRAILARRGKANPTRARRRAILARREKASPTRARRRAILARRAPLNPTRAPARARNVRLGRLGATPERLRTLPVSTAFRVRVALPRGRAGATFARAVCTASAVQSA